MKKLSVSEYASTFNVSVQSVYQKIKRGSLKSVEENGIKYVLLDNNEVKPDLNPKVESDCKDLLKLVKSQQKEIKRITKSLEKANKEKVETLHTYIRETKQLSAPVPKEEDFIEVKTKKKKKKKK